MDNMTVVPKKTIAESADFLRKEGVFVVPIERKSEKIKQLTR